MATVGVAVNHSMSSRYLCRTKSFLQSNAMLSHLDPPSSSSHSMRSVERTPGFLGLVKSERLAILLNTPV